MSFENVIPEPKKFFLNLLIKLDFEIASSLYRYNNYVDAINGIGQLLSLICARDKTDLKDIVTEIDQYLSQSSAPIEKLRPIFEKLQKYLQDKWFSELHLGVVPTSSLPTETKLPDNKPMDPKQSSRI